MARLPTFRDAYRLRRCIVPVDGFFEWKAIKGQRAKQPYAIAMKDGAPFGIGGIWGAPATSEKAPSRPLGPPVEAQPMWRASHIPTENDSGGLCPAPNT